MSHTPGPWIAESVGELSGGTPWWGVYANRAPVGLKMPAECHGPNAEANAKLIAAAPSLADALHAFVADFDNVRPNEDFGLLVDAARAALRLAGRLP